MVHTWNTGTQEAEAGGLWVQGQSGLHKEILSLPHNNNNNNNNNVSRS